MFPYLILYCIDCIFNNGFRWWCSGGLSHFKPIMHTQQCDQKNYWKIMFVDLFIIYASGARRDVFYQWKNANALWWLCDRQRQWRVKSVNGVVSGALVCIHHYLTDGCCVLVLRAAIVYAYIVLPVWLNQKNGDCTFDTVYFECRQWLPQ